MDQELLVDSRIDDGYRLLAQLLHDWFPVAVALWLNTSEEGLWFLYIASPSVDPRRPGEASGTVYASLFQIPGNSIAPSEIRLVSVDNPLAKEAQAQLERHRSRLPLRLKVQRFANVSVDEVYIYPPAAEPKQTAFDAIHDEAVKLMGYLDAKELDKVREGLNLIVSLARYEHDVRGAQELAKK